MSNIKSIFGKIKKNLLWPKTFNILHVYYVHDALFHFKLVSSKSYIHKFECALLSTYLTAQTLTALKICNASGPSKVKSFTNLLYFLQNSVKN
ncbi:hypothetical protein V1477_007168 [Vespula maculifrons]|uniref:Uncharacterized protein n=1 Tax=Vespula maculifrons TaxID=7453 RepID=A0ABD2CHR9_VESMC